MGVWSDNPKGAHPGAGGPEILILFPYTPEAYIKIAIQLFRNGYSTKTFVQVVFTRVITCEPIGCVDHILSAFTYLNVF